MDWNLEGKLVNATYCGIAVEGWVKKILLSVRRDGRAFNYPNTTR